MVDALQRTSVAALAAQDAEEARQERDRLKALLDEERLSLSILRDALTRVEAENAQLRADLKARDARWEQFKQEYATDEEPRSRVYWLKRMTALEREREGQS